MPLRFWVVQHVRSALPVDTLQLLELRPVKSVLLEGFQVQAVLVHVVRVKQVLLVQLLEKVGVLNAD